MNHFTYTQSQETSGPASIKQDFNPERSVLDLVPAEPREHVELPLAVDRLGGLTKFPILDASSWQSVLDIMVTCAAGDSPVPTLLARVTEELQDAGIDLEDRAVRLIASATADVADAPTVSAARCVTAVLGRASREASLAGWDMSVDDYYDVRDHLLGVGESPLRPPVGIAA